MGPMAEDEVRARRSSSVAMFSAADAAIDWARIAALVSDCGSSGKFYDVGKALYEGWAFAELLGLIDSRPLRVLDLGTGSGAFPFVCRYLGHDAIGLDIPEPGRHHSELRRALGVQVIEHRMQPMQPLPALADQRFDLVTGFRVQFDRKSSEKRWTADDWTYFLDDLRDHYLAPTGRLALCAKLNPERLELFTGRGGVLISEKRRLVLFDPLL